MMRSKTLHVPYITRQSFAISDPFRSWHQILGGVVGAHARGCVDHVTLTIPYTRTRTYTVPVRTVWVARIRVLQQTETAAKSTLDSQT